MTVAGSLALVVASMFTGAAFYINFAEQPARLQLADEPLLVQWKASYKRGFMMQATLAVVGFLLALLAWHETSNHLWLMGGVVLLANWPFTLVGIMPTNKALMSLTNDKAGQYSRLMIEKWNGLHAVRTALGVTAIMMLVIAAIT